MDLRLSRLRVALAIALVAVAGPAAALGLGQIQVKSKVDQPLLAEIPIISSDPSELEQLQARLASPDTFRRIGLDPPTGAAADLDFSVALDERGRPVIRVTSSAPVDQPLVTFLVEVDWGSGRLVREYSALLDSPRGQELLVRTPMRRFGELHELVGAAVFLASDAAAFVTGHILAVDGGYLASGVNQ